MLELLEDIRERSEEEDVPEKTIIFSQFTSYRKRTYFCMAQNLTSLKLTLSNLSSKTRDSNMSDVRLDFPVV